MSPSPGGRVLNWRRLTPGIAALAGYRRAWLRGDLLAGVTVAAYLVPQVMAYAGVAASRRSRACGRSSPHSRSTPSSARPGSSRSAPSRRPR